MIFDIRNLCLGILSKILIKSHTERYPKLIEKIVFNNHTDYQ